MGTLHGDYIQKLVNKRCPDERPFLIILVLDEFKFQYNNNNMGEKEEVCVPIGHVAIFSSALSHCGGANRTDDYVYHVFAYIVSNEVDYLDGEGGTIERDFEDESEKKVQVEGGKVGI
jgi:hypothetical protein